jgi:hypothetical protein
MSIIGESDIDYPRTVTVSRPAEGFDDTGDFIEGADVIVTGMTADIQQSLKIRNHLDEDASGTSDKTVWLMFSAPPVPLRAGDIVSDGDRTFIIDSVGDWGSHTECIMRQI